MIVVEKLSVAFDERRVLHEVDLAIPAGRLTAIVGPSGSGKSTLLRALNLLDIHADGYRLSGRILLEGDEITRSGVDDNHVRQQIGMVFQKPVVFPQSIAANVIFGVRHLALAPRADWPGIVEDALRRAALWDEVADRLDDPARYLSQGQQQRLCIARALAVRPRVLLLDEPTASLDPRSSEVIEGLMKSLLPATAVVLVTHHLAQARRLADVVALLFAGRLVEVGPAQEVFASARSAEARQYLALADRFGEGSPGAA